MKARQSIKQVLNDFNVIFLITLFSIGIFLVPSAVAQKNEAENVLENSIKYLDGNDYTKAIENTKLIPSLNSYKDDQRKKLYESFYKCFVALSKKQDIKGTSAIVTEWTRLFPNEKLNTLYLATIQYESGKTEEAITNFIKGYGLEEKYRIVDGELLQAFYYNTASLYHDFGMWDKSLEYAEKINKVKPGNPAVDFLKCRVLYNLSDYEKGKKACEEALKKNEKMATVVDYLTYAGYFRIFKDYEGSLKIVLEAFRHFPTTDGVAATAAADLFRLDKYYWALLLSFREDMNCSTIIAKAKRTDEIRKAVQDIVPAKDTEQAEKAIKVLDMLTLLNNKKYKEAIEEIDSLNENQLLYRGILEIFRGEALEEINELKKAENVYLTLKEKDPTLIMTYCKLFELYYKKLNNKEKAMTYFKMAKAMKPDHWKVAQIEAWLETQKKEGK
ncbi:MAG: hypothetical protein JW737_09320 [Acidobacteria bacterium]|nr:hypothetical protein [Acidobacteriota bacterium]